MKSASCTSSEDPGVFDQQCVSTSRGCPSISLALFLSHSLNDEAVLSIFHISVSLGLGSKTIKLEGYNGFTRPHSKVQPLIIPTKSCPARNLVQFPSTFFIYFFPPACWHHTRSEQFCQDAVNVCELVFLLQHLLFDLTFLRFHQELH